MGKTYLNLTTGTDNITKPRNITVASPYDVRTVVDTADDLYNKTTFGYSSLYIGMLVITYDTQDVYVLSKLPNSRDNEIKWRENIQWKKVGSIDLSEYAKLTDLDRYATKDSLLNFLTASDVEDFVSVNDVANLTSEFVSQSDLDVYVKTEDLVDFVTSSELDSRIAAIDIPEVPTNVSAFTNDAGYLTENDLPDFLLASDLDGYVKTSDLEAYIPKTELDKLATKSDLDGYVRTEDAVEYLTSSDLDGFATIDKIPTAGSFPETVDSPTTTSNGFATVQDVMDYVNALLEKKKESDYFYINAIKYTGSENPTPIYQMNCYEIGEEVELSTYNPAYTGTGFAIEVKCDTEVYGFYDKDDPSVTIYAEVLTIDIPDGYTLEVHGCDESGNYFIATEPMKVNYKGATKQYGSKTYNSYARSISDPYGDGRDLITGSARYLIIIKKIN